VLVSDWLSSNSGQPRPLQFDHEPTSKKTSLAVLVEGAVNCDNDGRGRNGVDTFGDAIELDEQYLGPDGVITLFYLGFILLTASPGVLIGYGYKRLGGAILGGITSFFLISFSVIAYACSGLDFF